jgi:hypothetical protein
LYYVDRRYHHHEQHQMQQQQHGVKHTAAASGFNGGGADEQASQGPRPLSAFSLGEQAMTLRLTVHEKEMELLHLRAQHLQLAVSGCHACWRRLGLPAASLQCMLVQPQKEHRALLHCPPPDSAGTHLYPCHYPRRRCRRRCRSTASVCSSSWRQQ